MTTETSTQGASRSTQPTHRLYRVTGVGEKTIWTPIGAAWPNRDGQGFNVTCDLVPLTGRIVMRKIKPQNADQGQLV